MFNVVNNYLEKPLVLAPLTDEEIKKLSVHGNFMKLYDIDELYMLYKNTNKRGEIEIGIPNLAKYSEEANMEGALEAKEKAFFYRLPFKNRERAELITDRPIYKVYPTLDAKVESFEILNNVDMDLERFLTVKEVPESEEVAYRWDQGVLWQKIERSVHNGYELTGEGIRPKDKEEVAKIVDDAIRVSITPYEEPKFC